MDRIQHIIDVYVCVKTSMQHVRIDISMVRAHAPCNTTWQMVFYSLSSNLFKEIHYALYIYMALLSLHGLIS